MTSQQVTDHFIGRSKEIETFRQWLGDPKAPWILYFYDALKEQEKKGGVGKTWLIRKCAELAQQMYPGTIVVMIDLFNIAQRDGIAIAEHLVGELQNAYPQWSAHEFTALLPQQRGADYKEKVEDSEFRAELSRALVDALKRLDEQLAFANKSLLLFFDTFELIEQNPTVAILNFSHTFPENYGFQRLGVVIASRNEIDWDHFNWLGRKKEVRLVAVAPFNQRETIEYLQRESIYLQIPPTQEQILYERTEGRPILVGLVTDILNQRIMTIEKLITVPKADFESYLVSQINRLTNPLNWIILFMAHVYHRFHADILDWILQDENLKDLVQDISHQEIIERLSTISFVRISISSQDFMLHDEMRRLVIRYCWHLQDPDQVYRKEISHRVIGYYEAALAQAQPERYRQASITELLYHRLFYDVNDGLQYFHEHFFWAFDRSKTAFARMLLSEAQQFEKLMPPVQIANLRLAEARLLHREEQPSLALAILEKLEAQASQEWREDHLSEVLEEQGRCYLMLGQFMEAGEEFDKCLALEKARNNQARVAIILNRLGFTYRNRGQYENARKYYDEGIALYKELANEGEYAAMLNNLSNIYRLQGKTQDALRKCKIGLHMREDLFQRGQLSEVGVGLSHSTMGLIYLEAGHFVWGEKHFQIAFEIFNRIGRKRDAVAMYNRFGQIEAARGYLSLALEWFEKAREGSRDINVEAYIISLSQIGQVLAQQKRYAEAVPFFEQAIAKAQQAHVDYQCTENLIDLAASLAHLKQEVRLKQLLGDAYAIATKWGYAQLLGRIEEVRGDLAYIALNYSDAFAHYRVFCRNMAIHSDVEYNKAISKVMDQTFLVPKTEIISILDGFDHYWRDENLDKKYPELLDAIEDVRRAILAG